METSLNENFNVFFQDMRCSDRRSLKSTGSSSRCRSHSPLKVECVSSTSLNSTRDSGHGSSPGSSGGSLPTRSRTVIEHAHKTTVAHDLSHKSTIVASFAQYPRSQSELELKLESSNSLSPANIPMLVVESYFPPKEWTSRDEVPVTRGMVVNAMFKTCEWICVRTPLERTGFIPFCCVQALGIKKNTKDFSQQFPETLATKTVHRRSPFKKSNSLNRTYHHYNVDKGTQSDSEMLTVKRAVREAAKTAVRGYQKKTVQSDLNNNKRPVLVKDQRAFTQPLPCKAMKPAAVSQQPLVPHKNTTVHSQTEIKPELPQRKVMEKVRVPECPSSVERRRQKAKEIYFAHDMSSIGFMLPHVKSPVKSPVLNLSFSSDVSEVSSVFTKTEGPRLTVLFDYRAQDENDVTVRQNDIVTLLNDEDEDWLWVRTDKGREGFIPRIYAVNLEALNLDPRAKTTYL